MGARFYDPYLARWLSADTMVPDPSNPQSFNRYSWVLGNPLKFVDPTGHKEEGACSVGDENEICENQEAVYEAYWAYCSENPADPACEPGSFLEGAFWFVAGVSGAMVVTDLILIGGGLLGEGVTKAVGWIGSLLCGDGNCTNEAEGLFSPGNISKIEDYLRSIDALDDTLAPYNRGMLDRMTQISNGEIAATIYDQRWMVHELMESQYVAQSQLAAGATDLQQLLQEAHAAVLNAQGLSQSWDLWPTEMIEIYQGTLSNLEWLRVAAQRGGQ
jgi:hypothetical protein